MKFTKVFYTKTYPLAFSGAFEKIYVEADLEDGDNPRQALYACKKEVENFHFESNKAAEKQAAIQEPSDMPPDRPKDIEGGIVYDIEHCNDLKVLDTYKFFLAKYPKTKVTYDNQLKKLL